MMTLFSSFRRHLCLMILCMGSWTVAPAQSELRVLGTDTPTSCTRCEGVLLPGGPVYPSSPVYSIHSDLPEIFHTPGVLYTTRKVLPPFDTYKDGPLPEAMRTQRASADYKGVDGDFEVFLYHMTEPGNGRSPRRVAVLVENTGTEPVVVTASEIMETTGPMGKLGGPEIRLSNRYHSGQWTQRFGEIEIAPGDMEVVSLTPRFGDGPGAPWIGTESDNVPQQDRSTSKFVTGQVMARVRSAAKPNLHVYVVGLNAPSTAPIATNHRAWTSLARPLLDRGAKSGETSMDLRIEPPACHLRRVAGVYRTFRWEGAATVTAADLATTDVRFQMALPHAQAANCSDGVQTQQMLLSPPYVRPETIGNYMVQYLVHLTLDNTKGTEPQDFDLRFGKQDASIGLSWQVARGRLAADAPEWKTAPLRDGWAGPWSLNDLSDNTLPFVEEPVRVGAGQSETVSVYFTIAGTSSLPFQIHVTKTRPGN